MVNKVVHAVFSETYDLNTAVDEMSIMGIHTPTSASLKKMFAGLFVNYQKFRILGCNLKMVCASQQSLDPSQMGLEAGSVDPRDVLNPILFKACTGEGMSAILDTAYNDVPLPSQTYGGAVTQTIVKGTSLASYYSMLADDSWRKSHPQHGLEISHLKPFVHKVVTTRPFKYQGFAPSQAVGDEGSGVSYPMIEGGRPNATSNDQKVVGFGSQVVTTGLTDEPAEQVSPTCFVSNGVTEMPWMETAIVNPTGTSATKYVLMNNIPRVYMGCIVLPPCILQPLFFRMTIAWHIEFKDFRPAIYLGGRYNDSTGQYDKLTIDVGDSTDNEGLYWNIYHSPTPAKLTKEVSSFTATDGVEVSKVMERGL